MNYEKLILELFTRVQELEEKVSYLESLQARISEPVESEVLESEKINRSQSRQYVIDRLKESNPGMLVYKANRALGGGIVIEDESSKEIKKAKFYHSKSHNEDFPVGWHTLNESELTENDMDIFIFNLEHKKEFYTFIFKKEELEDYVKSKEKDQNNNYYFYFVVKGNSIYEARDGEKDVSRYLDRWNIVSEVF